MADKISAAQQRAIDWIQGKRASELGALGAEIGRMLAELTAELMDSKLEAFHWKTSFETVRNELKVMAATVIAKQGGGRLVLKREDYAKSSGLELFCDDQSEKNTHVYELRSVIDGATPVQRAVSSIIRTH